MIFGHIACKDPFIFPLYIRKGLEFLRNTDFSKCEIGKIPLEGDKLFAELIETTTRKVQESEVEFHEKYIDIHYLAKGKEYIGTVSDLGNNVVSKSLMPGRDIAFYKSVEHESFLEMIPGSYAIFFPQDIHRPATTMGEKTLIHKVVVKIAVSTLHEM